MTIIEHQTLQGQICLLFIDSKIQSRKPWKTMHVGQNMWRPGLKILDWLLHHRNTILSFYWSKHRSLFTFLWGNYFKKVQYDCWWLEKAYVVKTRRILGGTLLLTHLVNWFPYWLALCKGNKEIHMRIHHWFCKSFPWHIWWADLMFTT